MKQILALGFLFGTIIGGISMISYGSFVMGKYQAREEIIDATISALNGQWLI